MHAASYTLEVVLLLLVPDLHRPLPHLFPSSCFCCYDVLVVLLLLVSVPNSSPAACFGLGQPFCCLFCLGTALLLFFLGTALLLLFCVWDSPSAAGFCPEDPCRCCCCCVSSAWYWICWLTGPAGSTYTSAILPGGPALPWLRMLLLPPATVPAFPDQKNSKGGPADADILLQVLANISLSGTGWGITNI